MLLMMMASVLDFIECGYYTRLEEQKKEGNEAGTASESLS
jgi:hypothetical protein